MTTLDTIPLLSAQITEVYETMSKFLPSNIDSEIEVCDGKHCIDISYLDLGEGEIADLEFTFFKKYISGKWIRIGGIMDVNEKRLEVAFKAMMKAHYEVKLREYNEEHAAEIAE